ncbi:hypothetical protein B0H14DRAFT_3854367 [Mycena olivaceomarginata]|nr:hypothetical protein B0H14DRAFT_3854367 [Mycena olivaceomarginata]
MRHGPNDHGHEIGTRAARMRIRVHPCAPMTLVRILGKAQFSAKVAEFDNVKRAETPAEDAKTRATLLGISSDKLGDTAVGFPKGRGDLCLLRSRLHVPRHRRD